MLRIGIIFGGRSGEHDVSRCSAASVLQNLDKTKYEIVAIGIDRDGRWYPDDSPSVNDDTVFGSVLNIKKNGDWYFNVYPDENQLKFFDRKSDKTVVIDVAFPVIHGTGCEDGKLQGILESAGVAYVGADVLGSAMGMDKDVTKRILDQAGIPVVPWLTVHKEAWEDSCDFVIEEIKMDFGFPCFVKPANAGSSVGIYKIAEPSDLDKNIRSAFEFDTKVLIEKAVSCKEIEFAVLGNDKPRCTVGGEVIPNHEFYSFEAKYVDKDGALLRIPADIGQTQMKEMRQCALEAYQLLCLKGMCRIDFFIDKESGSFYLNEVNTLPGFTSISMYPKLWMEEGIEYPQLLDFLIDLALQAFAEKSSIKREF
ncbi:MAG: D-alanine--D-alanine ligase [Spirochaetes bacterium]|jgi:D-alanine-D-alanine ligase|nr:D-alanine--D-alanine ligase [Spirochaetota bacterium]